MLLSLSVGALSVKFIVGGFLAHAKFVGKLPDILTPAFSFIRTAPHCGRDVLV